MTSELDIVITPHSRASVHVEGQHLVPLFAECAIRHMKPTSRRPRYDEWLISVESVDRFAAAARRAGRHVRTELG